MKNTLSLPASLVVPLLWFRSLRSFCVPSDEEFLGRLFPTILTLAWQMIALPERLTSRMVCVKWQDKSGEFLVEMSINGYDETIASTADSRTIRFRRSREHVMVTPWVNRLIGQRQVDAFLARVQVTRVDAHTPTHTMDVYLFPELAGIMPWNERIFFCVDEQVAGVRAGEGSMAEFQTELQRLRGVEGPNQVDLFPDAASR